MEHQRTRAHAGKNSRPLTNFKTGKFSDQEQTAMINFIPTGFENYDFRDMKTNDNGKYILANNDGFCIYSNDYGFTWYNLYFPNSTAESVCVDNAISGNGQVFYVILDGATIYRSTNPLNQWTTLPSISSASSYESIATDYSGNQVFVGGEFYNQTSTRSYNAIYSNNGGNTFTILTNIQHECEQVVLDNSGSNLLCAGTHIQNNLTISISNDTGTTFVQRVIELPYLFESYYSIIASAYNENMNIYVALTNAQWNEIFVSHDNGLTWNTSQFDSYAYMFPYAIATTGTGENIYIAGSNGLHCSDNYGNSWYLCYESSVFDVTVSGSGANIYIETEQGTMAYRNDTSLTATPSIPPTMAPTTYMWRQTPIPPSPKGYDMLAISANGEYVVLAQAYEGHLVSVTNPMDTTNAIIANNSDIKYDWTDLCMSYDGSKVVAMTGDPIYYSTNQNITNLTQATYNNTLSNKYSVIPTHCAINSAGTVTVIANFVSNPAMTVAIYVNTNPQSPYSPVFTTLTTIPNEVLTEQPTIHDIQIDSTGNVIALLLETPSWLVVSTDQGITWSILSYESYSPEITMFSMSQEAYGQYMVSALDGMSNTAYSMNQGVNWTSSNTVPDEDSLFTIDSSYSGQYAITASLQNIYISSDYGMTWNLSYSFPTEFYYTNAAVDPTGQFYAAIQPQSSVDENYLMWHYAALPTMSPTTMPTWSAAPTMTPTIVPSTIPTYTPTMLPTMIPTELPTQESKISSSSSSSLSVTAVVWIVLGIIVLIACICGGLCCTGVFGKFGFNSNSKGQDMIDDHETDGSPAGMEMGNPKATFNPVYRSVPN